MTYGDFKDLNGRTAADKAYQNLIDINADLLQEDNIVNKHNKTFHSTIKMKPVDVISSTYIDSNKEINNKDPKFKIGDIVRISKHENFLQKVTFES